jgi:hypothetical protein
MDLRKLSSPFHLHGYLFLALLAHTAFGQSIVPLSMADSELRPRHGSANQRLLEIEYTGALFGYYRIEPNRGPVMGRTMKRLSAVEQFQGRRCTESKTLPEKSRRLRISGHRNQTPC